MNHILFSDNFQWCFTGYLNSVTGTLVPGSLFQSAQSDIYFKYSPENMWISFQNFLIDLDGEKSPNGLIGNGKFQFRVSLQKTIFEFPLWTIFTSVEWMVCKLVWKCWIWLMAEAISQLHEKNTKKQSIKMHTAKPSVYLEGILWYFHHPISNRNFCRFFKDGFISLSRWQFPIFSKFRTIVMYIEIRSPQRYRLQEIICNLLFLWFAIRFESVRFRWQ